MPAADKDGSYRYLSFDAPPPHSLFHNYTMRSSYKRMMSSNAHRATPKSKSHDEAVEEHQRAEDKIYIERKLDEAFEALGATSADM